MNRKKPPLAYRRAYPIRLECTIDLDQLFDSERERVRFAKGWIHFLRSDPYNEEIFKLNGSQLTCSSEHLVPRKKDDRPPLLLVFGNPASHSVAAGMFFAFKDNGKENRQRWKIGSNSYLLFIFSVWWSLYFIIILWMKSKNGFFSSDTINQ